MPASTHCEYDPVGRRIAVIENEFGEVGVDDSLIKQRFKTDEDIFEMCANRQPEVALRPEPWLPSACVACLAGIMGASAALCEGTSSVSWANSSA